MNDKMQITSRSDVASLLVTAEKTDKGYFATIKTKTDKLYSEGYFTAADLPTPHGKFLVYDTTSGRLMKKINMHYGYYLGNFITYHPSGVMADSGDMYYNLPKGRWVGMHENGELKYNAKFADSFATPATVYQTGNAQAKAKKIGSYVNEFFDPEAKIGLWEIFYDNGNRKDSINYVVGETQGFAKTWYKNGNLESEGFYDRGIPSGEWNWYHENGAKATQEIYVNGTIKELKCFDTTGKYIGDNCGVVRQAYYPSGTLALENFVNTEIWPVVNKMLTQKDILISFTFSISPTGEIDAVEMQPNIDAIKMAITPKLKSMPKWVPAISHNRQVTATQTITEYFLE